MKITRLALLISALTSFVAWADQPTTLLFSDWSNKYGIQEAIRSKEIVNSQTVGEYLEKAKIDLEILPHPDRDTSEQARRLWQERVLKYGVENFPTALVLLDENGTLIGRWLGPIEDKKELLQWLKKPTRQISERNVDDDVVVTFEKKRTTVKELRERSLMLYAVGTLLPGTVAPYDANQQQEAIGNAMRKVAVEENKGKNRLAESIAANGNSLLVCDETEAWKEVSDDEDRLAIFHFCGDGTFTWAVEYGDQGGRRMRLGAGIWLQDGDLLQTRDASSENDFSREGKLPDPIRYNILSLTKGTLKLTGLKADVKTGKPVETVFQKITDWSDS